MSNANGRTIKEMIVRLCKTTGVLRSIILVHRREKSFIGLRKRKCSLEDQLFKHFQGCRQKTERKNGTLYEVRQERCSPPWCRECFLSCCIVLCCIVVTFVMHANLACLCFGKSSNRTRKCWQRRGRCYTDVLQWGKRPVPQVMESVLDRSPICSYSPTWGRQSAWTPMHVGGCMWWWECAGILNATFITRKKKTKLTCASKDRVVIVVV